MATLPPSPFDRDRRNRRTMMAMAGVGLSMLALGFASVPSYRFKEIRDTQITLFQNSLQYG